MEATKAVLTFASGVGTVTGANFLLELKGKRILIDCGMEQGSEAAEAHNREPFPFDPASIDVLLVTHAHIDHVGRIPKLVKEGFQGVIYSSPATHEISLPMLQDAARLVSESATRKGILPMYDEHDVEPAMRLWKEIPYYTPYDVGGGIMVNLKDAGHILGSVMFEISVSGSDKKIVFTGDLGNSPSLFLRDTDAITDATYMVMESVYGDRNHESKDERRSKLKEIILDTIKRKRTLVIPAFSLERTQDIIYEMNDFFEKDHLESVKVFIDSPLAAKVTDIYRKYSLDFKDSAREQIAKGDDLFMFPRLKFTVQHHESASIERGENPKIILGGSGMSNGGRIVDHERNYLPDPEATILLVGYQSAGTLGRQILDGAKQVNIHGEKVQVRAEIKSIMGYSSHKDSDHLIEFVEHTAKTVKKVFVAMGEPKASLFLVQRLRDYLNVDAVYPKKGDSVEIEL